MVLNAWYTAVGQHMLLTPSISFQQAFSRLNYGRIVLLGGATAWGARLMYRIVSRSLRRGKDDARYDGVKETKGFWNQALFSVFVPEAVFQAIISLPFTMPFRPEAMGSLTGASSEWSHTVRLAAAAIFTFGFAIESLADRHLESPKRNTEAQGRSAMCTSGVWSIVRHPNYLGDALCHLAFPLWNYGSGLYNPWQLLGPVANYLFLRGIGGDKQNEASQEERYLRDDKTKFSQLQTYQTEKNSFWPGVSELVNPWMLICVGASAIAAGAEYAIEMYH